MDEEILERARKSQEANASVSKKVIENPDSIEIGTPSKGGAVKIYGDFSDQDAFKKKIDNAKEVKAYANANLMVNI